jgi:hypothetical protein
MRGIAWGIRCSSWSVETSCVLSTSFTDAGTSSQHGTVPDAAQHHVVNQRRDSDPLARLMVPGERHRTGRRNALGCTTGAHGQERHAAAAGPASARQRTAGTAPAPLTRLRRKPRITSLYDCTAMLHYIRCVKCQQRWQPTPGAPTRTPHGLSAACTGGVNRVRIERRSYRRRLQAARGGRACSSRHQHHRQPPPAHP